MYYCHRHNKAIETEYSCLECLNESMAPVFEKIKGAKDLGEKVEMKNVLINQRVDLHLSNRRRLLAIADEVRDANDGISDITLREIEQRLREIAGCNRV